MAGLSLVLHVVATKLGTPRALHQLLLIPTGQADVRLVLHPWRRLVQPLVVDQLHPVDQAGALLVVQHIGPLPCVHGHHAHDYSLSLRPVSVSQLVLFLGCFGYIIVSLLCISALKKIGAMLQLSSGLQSTLAA